MPLRNRVTPFGDLIATDARGLVYGNRGCLHDEDKSIRRHYNGKRWIACRLRFRGWHREPLMQPGRFTELFFLDEATAFAAGHRPCALCRREDYTRFVEIWRERNPHERGADEIDSHLHRERLSANSRERRLHDAEFADLPDGSFVIYEDSPWLVLDSLLVRWTAEGYAEKKALEGKRTTLLTPPSLVEVLRSDWRPVVPLLHPSVLEGGQR
jgi:hypothetical protein